MTYSASSTAPLIYFPDIAGQFTNYDFEAAALATNWTVVGPATKDTTLFRYGTASCKFAPVGAATTIQQTQTFAIAPGWKITGNLEPLYVYFWAQRTSGTGTFTVTVDTRTSVPATVKTFTDAITISTIGTNWGLYRSGPFTPVTADYAAVDRFRITLGMTGADTYVLNIDNVYLGHALDFQDIGITGACDIVHPYKYRKEVFCDYDESEYGAYSSRRYNLGFYTGEFETTGFPESARSSWQNFADYGMDGTAWSLWHDRTRVDRDYFAKVMTDQDHYGTEMIDGKTDWKAKMKWRQVIA